MGHGSVKEMLQCISSSELAEWMAYERVAGPIGTVYQNAALRHIANSLRGDENAPVFPTPMEWMGARPREVDDGDRDFLRI